MIITQPGFSCSQCNRLIDIGEPFLATATYPARSYLQSEAVDADFLRSQGEILCRKCATERIGAEALSRLHGAVFTAPTLDGQKSRHHS